MASRERGARLEIGGIARAHGIRGEVVVHTHDPASTVLGAVGTVWVGGVARAVLGARDTDRGWLLQLDGVKTRDDAEALRGQVVEVSRDAVPVAEGEVLLADLVGCRVELADGRAWGSIAAVTPGVQDLLVIHDGEVERLLPLVDRFVTAIDVAGGVVTVDPPDGLPESRRGR